MRIGFTGTQQGMSVNQRQLVESILTVYPWTEFHHGDCVGSDAEAHAIAMDMGYDEGRQIHIHPPINPAKRAYCNAENVILWPEKEYLDRNRDIVDFCDMLIATPAEPETVRSGTWATIRYARKAWRATMVLER